jgi:hypothetical protein
MKKSTQLFVSTIIGVLFLLAILILIVAIPCPTKSQYNIFRIIISIAIAAFASIIPGLFDFRYKEFLTATGALGVFAFIFLFDPTQLITTDDCFEKDLFVAGIVYVNDKETKNIDVRIPELKKQATTDEYGSFKIEYPTKDKKDSLNFRFLYGTSLDKSLTVTKKEKKDWHNLRFDFSVDTNKVVINPVAKPTDSGAIKVPVQIPKKEINNYFEGELPESGTVSYGGDPYCLYAMRYTNIKVQIKLSKNRTSVESAKIKFKANEKANPDCPFQKVPPNTHLYDLSSATINGKNLFINFTPDHSNNPLCSLTLSGIIENTKIIASLYSERIDMPDPKLVFKIRMDMQIEIVE